MTQKQKDKILKALAEEKNEFTKNCNEQIIMAQGKIMGANYMFHRFFDILNTENEPQKSGDKK